MSVLDQLFDAIGLSQESYSAVLKIFTVVFIAGALSYFSGKVLDKLGKQLAKTHNLWDDTLVEAARPPLKLMIWVVGVSLAAEIAQSYSGAGVFEYIDSGRKVFVIYCLIWFLIRFISGAEKILVSDSKMKEPMDETTVAAIGKLTRVSVIITGVLVVLQTLGFSISGVLAFGGIGGIAVGFAAKDLLANFFGGLMVYLDRPFSVGDWIRSPDKNIEGTVENIGWRTTRIRTFEKRPIYVPNSTFMSLTVENPSRMTHRRINENIGVRYCDAGKIENILREVKQMLIDHDDLDTDQTLIVNFNMFGPSSLDFFIYTFTKTTNWIEFHQVKQNVLLEVMRIIEANGAEIAFPTRTLYMAEAPGPSENDPTAVLEAKE
ncbi:MAG: mechanosensitive ion channel family protein [Hahellaceae bacterium]|nr:mechanosensitive ion channel family protein [Hahellaceae bacterium]MCP5212090.1 mechanosensitive ion channel family protein [Hahellaceae bacterium]